MSLETRSPRMSFSQSPDAISQKSLSNRQQLLAIATEYLQTTVASQAAQLDQQPEVLQQALKGLGDRALLALRVPLDLGGAGLRETDYRRFQIIAARYSGALAFLQTQHQSAASQLAASSNQLLQQTYLSQMATGKVLVGIGYSHLRRRGEPIIKATEIENGYILNGEVPWITGFGFFDHFILGAALPDGREVYGMLPFKATQQNPGGYISFSPPMQLVAIAATNTVSAKLKGWQLDRQDIVAIKPAGSIHQNSQKNILHHGFFALGCAYAGIDIIATAYDRKQLPFLQESWQALQQEVKDCEQAMFAALSSDTAYEQKLQLRARAINLAGRCSQGAVIASSGAANYLDHAAGRVYREALLFAVSGQTTAVMAESLKQLLSTSK